jgi:hypothetical protein
MSPINLPLPYYAVGRTGIGAELLPLMEAVMLLEGVPGDKTYSHATSAVMRLTQTR